MKRIRPAVILIENNHVLLMKYQYGNQFLYNFPGGNMDEGETMPETIIRECQEELGIEVEVQDLAFLGEIEANEYRVASLHPVFFGKILGGIPVIQHKETISMEVVWVKLEELSSLHVYPNISIALIDTFITGKTGKYLGIIHQPWI